MKLLERIASGDLQMHPRGLCNGGTAPDYDNERMGGPDGIRIPQEMGKCTFAVTKEVDINIGGAGSTNTINLTPDQLRASYIALTNAGSGATTVNWPAVLPGVVFTVWNNSGQAATFKVTGKTGISVANGKRAILAMDSVLADIARVTPDT
jgi:hypothetical protein